MPTITAIAAHLGVSQPRATQLVKQGMPTNSLRAAELWREKRPRRRAPTNGKFAGEAPPEPPAEKGNKRRGRPITPKQPSKTGDSLLDALNNAITIQERAFDQAEKAMITDSPDMSIKLSVHTKALEARFMAEDAYRAEMERRNLLVNKTVIVEMVRRTMEPVLRRLRRLPQERGPECHDAENSLSAVKILEREVNSIIAVGRKALDEFTSAA